MNLTLSQFEAPRIQNLALFWVIETRIENLQLKTEADFAQSFDRGSAAISSFTYN